jgi:hypothetical protein
MLELAATSTEYRVVRALSRAGAWAAAAVAVLTVVWLGTMIVWPPYSGGTTAEHLEALLADDVRWSLGFAVTLPLGLALVPVWIALAARAWRAHPVAASLTLVYGLMYAPLSTTAYWLQLTTARGVAETYGRDPAAALAAYQLFDFGTTASLTTAFDTLGYAVLGLGTMSVAVLVWAEGRLGRLIGFMFAVSGALSIAGAVGIALRWDWLGVAAIASGVPFLAAIAAVPRLLWIPGHVE